MGEVTIKELAKICGVGVSTISRAINNHPDINPETKEMVLQKAKEVGYVPNNSARNLKRTDSKSVAVLVKGITNPFFTEMIKIIEIECKSRRYSMYLQHVDSEENEVDVAQEMIKEKRLRGIVFLGGLYAHSEDKLAKLTVPYVFSTAGMIPQNYDQQLYSSITINDRKESCRMVEYLIGLGHKRIAIIVADHEEESIGMLRLKGYMDALKKHDIELDEELIISADFDKENFTMKNGYRAMNELLSKKIEFTAVYAVSDTLAIGAMRALHDANLSVPEQVSVAGYDGLDMISYIVPSITTIKQPTEKMAHDTMNLLFDIITGNTSPQHIRYDGEILVNESTGPVRKE